MEPHPKEFPDWGKSDPEHQQVQIQLSTGIKKPHKNPTYSPLEAPIHLHHPPFLKFSMEAFYFWFSASYSTLNTPTCVHT